MSTHPAGQRGRAWAIAIVGGLIALDIASIAGGAHPAAQLHAGYAYAPAWFPLSIASPDLLVHLVTFGRAGWTGHYIDGVLYGSDWPSQVLLIGAGGAGSPGGLADIAGPLMLCSAFVTAYAMRASRVVGAVTYRPAVPAPALVRTARTVRVVAAVGLGIGLLTWTFVAGTRLYSHGAWETDNDLLLLRVAAIALVVIATVVLLAGRGVRTRAAIWRRTSFC